MTPKIKGYNPHNWQLVPVWTVLHPLSHEPSRKNYHRRLNGGIRHALWHPLTGNFATTEAQDLFAIFTGSPNRPATRNGADTVLPPERSRSIFDRIFQG